MGLGTQRNTQELEPLPERWGRLLSTAFTFPCSWGEDVAWRLGNEHLCSSLSFMGYFVT